MSFFVCFISPYRYAEDWTSCHWLEYRVFYMHSLNYTFSWNHFISPTYQ